MLPEFPMPRSIPGWLALVLLVIAAPAAQAQSQAYTVDIRPVLNGLDIKIGHVADTSMLVVNLTNNSPTRVRCNLLFDASPQKPHRTTRHINAGQRNSSVLRAQRRWFSVTVDVACEPAPR